MLCAVGQPHQMLKEGNFITHLPMTRALPLYVTLITYSPGVHAHSRDILQSVIKRFLVCQ